MQNYGEASLVNTIFRANQALATGGSFAGIGGGLQNAGAADLINVTIVGNSAETHSHSYPGQGGGIANSGSLFLVNSIVWGNTADDGAQIHGAATATYSDVQGGGYHGHRQHQRRPAVRGCGER